MIDGLSVFELNYLLYRCDNEERDANGGSACYHVPGYGDLVYAGLQGFMSVIQNPDSYAYHCLNENLKVGSWALWYTSNRLKRGKLKFVSKWLEERWNEIETLPSHTRPFWFFEVIKYVYGLAVAYIYEKHFKYGDIESYDMPFAFTLTLGSIQMLGESRSGGLPSRCFIDKDNETIASLAAGLPHFSTRHMRCWGRDTFIAFRGFFLHIGLHSHGLDHLVAFASCIYNGLIPNLLDGGNYPRYNSRDATWWWVKALQDYHELHPHVLDVQLRRRFPRSKGYVWCEPDDPRAFSQIATLKDILVEVLSRHYTGIEFVEPRAEEYTELCPEGYIIKSQRDHTTGFLHGGNIWNACTWMDKVGECKATGNYRIPSTPRDGAPIEITALVHRALCWAEQLKLGLDFVSEWRQSIEHSFEKEYLFYDDLSNKMYYKDLVGCENVQHGLELRPNYLIAMVVVNEFFLRLHHCLAKRTRLRP